ncbi:MAG TPA: rod shape-determining protein MreC [Verrucomicrobiales bacterium]|nr:MAG: rod shape-determining protein MreC [Verrucomicrobiae bacterium Tous-C3TDCM]PAZ04793.1 MAG: rod shape-determining protein MreC [Verrucomicrobiae bacterium AMD-G2]HBE22405.1 rod shape-determining protein MreC [Verrucomicrobiales bacterium]
MKPLNLIALLCFLGGATWALTRSDRSVRSIQNAYYSAISPFLKSGSAIEEKARNFSNEVTHSRSLEAALEVTKAELDKLKLIEQRFDTLEAENARLRSALKFTENTKFTLIAANITRRQTTNWYKTVEINRGEESFIGIQNPVVTAEGLVGKIDLIAQDFATVILLTDKSCQVSAKVEGSADLGIISGRPAEYGKDPMLILSYLPKNTNLKKGQRVFSDGRGGITPANILIGTIESVESGAMYSEALVHPAVNFNDLATVFVIPREN